MEDEELMEDVDELDVDEEDEVELLVEDEVLDEVEDEDEDRTYVLPFWKAFTHSLRCMPQ